MDNANTNTSGNQSTVGDDLEAKPENEAMSLPPGSFDVEELIRAGSLTGEDRQSAIAKANKTTIAQASQGGDSTDEQGPADLDGADDLASGSDTTSETPKPAETPPASSSADPAPKPATGSGASKKAGSGTKE